MDKNQSARTINDIKTEIKMVAEKINQSCTTEELTPLIDTLSKLNFELNCALNPTTI